MAWYLLKLVGDKTSDYWIVEADSAKNALDDQPTLTGDTIDVWTLRSGEPRRFEISVEEVRTVKRVT